MADIYVICHLMNCEKWPFSQLTFLICITMYLNVNVRQFRAETAKLPEIASHPRSNTL